MDALRSDGGSMTPSMLVLLGLSILQVLLATQLRESSLLTASAVAPDT